MATAVGICYKFIQGLLKAPEQEKIIFPKFVETGPLKKTWGIISQLRSKI